jgi:fused signal recognition particle receptor
MNHSTNACMFRFFKNPRPQRPPLVSQQRVLLRHPPQPAMGALDRLKAGLGKTASGLASVFGGNRIDEALFEDLENALLMADTGVSATAYLIAQLPPAAKSAQTQTPSELRALLTELLTELLLPLEKTFPVGPAQPTVVMVAGVNGAGKTTSIGKLTAHLAGSGASVLLAAADTFRAAAREQLAVWADRNTVDIVTQAGGDPAAVSFDAVTAGKARGKDVVLIDTAGRLPTQLHLMEELRKMKRVVQKAGRCSRSGNLSARSIVGD